jgi:hypothetical protein
VTWGGARKGAGRKRKAPPAPDAKAPEPDLSGPRPLSADLVTELAAMHAGKSPEEIMELSMRVLAAAGDFRGAALAAARLAAARSRPGASKSAAGKKEAAHAAALDRATGASPFAVPPPPKNLN